MESKDTMEHIAKSLELLALFEGVKTGFIRMAPSSIEAISDKIKEVHPGLALLYPPVQDAGGSK